MEFPGSWIMALFLVFLLHGTILAGDPARDFPDSGMKPRFKESAIIKAHDPHLSRIALSPDNSFLASLGDDGAIRLWEMPSGKLRNILKGLEGATGFTITAGGRRIVTWGWGDKKLIFWDTATGRILKEDEGPFSELLVTESASKIIAMSFKPPSSVSLVPFDPDGKRLGAIGFQTPGTGDSLFFKSAASRDGSLFFAYGTTFARDVDDDVIEAVWDLRTGKELWRNKGEDRDLLRASFSPDGKFLVLCISDPIEEAKGTIRLRNPSTGEAIREWPSDPQNVYSMAFVKGGKYLLTGGNGTIYLWSFPDGKKIAERKNVLRGEFRYIALSAGERFLIAGGAYESRIAVLRLPGLEVVRVLDGHPATLRGLAVDWQHGILASADVRGFVHLWKITEESESKETEEAPPAAWNPEDLLPLVKGLKRREAGIDSPSPEYPGAVTGGAEYLKGDDPRERIGVWLAVFPDSSPFEAKHEAERWMSKFSELASYVTGGDTGKWAAAKTIDGNHLWTAALQPERLWKDGVPRSRLFVWAGERRAVVVFGGELAGVKDVVRAFLKKYPSTLDASAPKLSPSSWARHEVELWAPLLRHPDTSVRDGAVQLLRRITGRPFETYRLGAALKAQRPAIQAIETWVRENLETLVWDEEIDRFK